MSHDRTTTALALIEPANMNELSVFAESAAKSGFFGAKTREQALMIAMRGRSLGLDYSTALAAMHVIEGRPTLTADAMVAICLSRSDVCESFDTIESTNERCIVEAKRRGKPARRHEYSMEDAKRAGLAGKQMWQKYPRNMLRARAKSELARDMFPELLLGLYTADEVSSGAAAIDTGIDESVRGGKLADVTVIDAEVVEPPPKPPAKTPTLADIDLTDSDVDAWLATFTGDDKKKPLAERDPGEMDSLVRAMAPGKAARKQFDTWMLVNRPTEAK